jgi:hypothetical protein
MDAVDDRAGSGPFLDLKPPGTGSPAKVFPFGATSITLPTPASGKGSLDPAADPFGAFTSSSSGPGTASLGSSAALEALPLFGPSPQEVLDAKGELVENVAASAPVAADEGSKAGVDPMLNAAGSPRPASAVMSAPGGAPTSALLSAPAGADAKIDDPKSADKDEAPQSKRPRHSITPPVDCDDDDAPRAAPTISTAKLSLNEPAFTTRALLSMALSEALSQGGADGSAACLLPGGDRLWSVEDLVRAHKLDVEYEVDSYLEGPRPAGRDAFDARGCAAHLVALAKRREEEATAEAASAAVAAPGE